MTGAKTNERPGTRAQARHIRGSASKARRVLNMIRNHSVEDARSLLEFSDVGVAETVSKVLESAVANASHNDGIADDELYVAACYADEGVTLKRFRPRARGRASRINKRTCHITVIVARYENDELEDRRERQAERGGTSAAQAEARRRRVSRSQGADDSGDSEDAAPVDTAPVDTASDVATSEEEE
jgi:large subunit ribosomal protein L22